jgi:purine catabolism regulator
MATLRDLQRAILPSARPIGSSRLSARQAAREVAWVRVLKARVPAFDALEPGDLAIIPGASLVIVAPGPPQTEELAAALARSSVPAIVLVDGDAGADALVALGRAAVELGLTVLRVGRTDPVVLERSIIGYLVNRRAELDHRAGELETELARLALLGRGLDTLAASIGQFLGRAVVIEGRRGDALAVHAPADVPAAATAYGRYRSHPQTAALRVAIPAPPGETGGGGGGRLVLLGEDPPNELERVASERIAALLALELARDAAVRHAREDARRGDPLPPDGPPWVVMLARQGPSDGPGDVAAREATRAELQLLLPPRQATLRGTAESLELRLVAAASPDDPAATLLAARVAGFLRRPVAVSRPFIEPVGRPGAEAEARTTLEAAEALPAPPTVARADRLAAYRLVGNLHNLPDGRRDARALLEPLLSGRPDVRDEHLATLRAVLEQPGIAEAAASLGVHRNTVAYRVRRIESLTGWRLSDPELRLPLAMAVKLVQTQQG